MTGKKRGPYSKIDQVKVEKLLQAVRTGASLEIAAAYAGIARQTFFDWMRRGRQPRPAAVYKEFADRVDEAMSVFEVQALARITKAGETEWQADAWRLERKFPDRYGRRSRVDSNVTVTAQPMWDTTKLTLAEKRELARLLRKCSPEPEQLEQGQQPVLQLLPGGDTIDGEVVKETG